MLEKIISIIDVILKWGGYFIKKLFHSDDEVLYKIPKKSIIIVPTSNSNDIRWHMGSSSGKPIMQVVGRFNVTNITKYNLSLTAVKMKKPKVSGHLMVKDSDSNYFGSYPIPDGELTEISFDFWIKPPLKKEGEVFIADVAIIDQFGNEHWVKRIEFKYL